MINDIKNMLERIRASAPNVLAAPDAAARLRQEKLPYGVEIIESEYMPKGTIYIVAKNDLDGTIDTTKIVNVDGA